MTCAMLLDFDLWRTWLRVSNYGCGETFSCRRETLESCSTQGYTGLHVLAWRWSCGTVKQVLDSCFNITKSVLLLIVGLSIEYYLFYLHDASFHIHTDEQHHYRIDDRKSIMSCWKQQSQETSSDSLLPPPLPLCVSLYLSLSSFSFS